MSEYQYYEFITLDRHLTEKEMEELRALSTRAEISLTRFTNVYHFGSFRGRPEEMMQRYFDAFVYVANWGTHQLMLRFPKGTLDPEELEPYCDARSLSLHKGEALVLDFINQPEDSWEDESGSEWMATLSRLRDELLSGDFRALYLGWLGGIHEHEEEEQEPMLPPGLNNLSAPLSNLAKFLRIDRGLLAVAAESSNDATSNNQELEQWVTLLPSTEKDRLLVSMIQGKEPLLGPRLLQRFRASRPSPAQRNKRRTVGELMYASKQREEEHARREEQRKTAEKMAREAKQAAEREIHLEAISSKQEELWGRVESLVQMKFPKAYDEAVALLISLRDVAIKNSTYKEFQGRIASLKAQHATKRTFLSRLNDGKL